MITHEACDGCAECEPSDAPLPLDWCISAECLAALGLPVDTRWRRHRALGTLVAAAVARADRWTSYSRNHNWYADLVRRYVRPGISHRTVVDAVDVLLEHELIEDDRSWPGRLGIQSRFRATPKLLSNWAENWAGFQHNPREVIRLKDDQKQLIDYSDTGATIKMRHAVLDLNEALASAMLSFDGDIQQLPPHLRHFAVQVRGYRVFNLGSFTAGGRLYGIAIQNMEKQHRARLRLSGHPIEEPDYPNLHALLSYAEAGAVLHGDAYTISGLENRRADVKLAWMMLINAGSRKAAVLALADALNKRYPDEGRKQTRQDAVELLDRVAARHAPIQSHFYTCAARRLQFVDSQLMLAVEGRCLKDGIVALPIHDSFVVARGRDADRLREFMDEELEKIIIRLRALV